MAAGAWALARRQHEVVTRDQLLAIGFSRHAIDHRLASGRLHRVHRAVYAVGRRPLTRHGEFMAAVLRCGPTGALSHVFSGVVWGIIPDRRAPIEVSVSGAARRVPGIVVHRQRHRVVVRRHNIPITGMPQRPGVDILRHTLDRHTFRVTRSTLERHLLPIARRVGLPLPLTRVIVNGYEVDFYWPAYRLIVETDGLTHHQVVHEPEYVESILRRVVFG